MQRLAHLLVAALVLSQTAATAAESPAWLPRERLASLFPGADTAGSFEGNPPAAPVRRAGAVVGYLFSTKAVIGSTGYSGKPLDILVGLDLDGRITGAELVSHQEPILVIGIPDAAIRRFVARFGGIDIRHRIKVGGRTGKGRTGIDGVSGATVSSIVIADAILTSARKVARSRGILPADGGAGRARIDIDRFEQQGWPQLVAAGAIARQRLSNREVAAKLAEAGAAQADNRTPDDTFIELYAALMTPAMVGRNLLGPRRYNRLMAERPAGEEYLFIAASGLYSFKGTAYRASGTFDRVQIVQGARTLRLTERQHHRIDKLALEGAPELREMAFFALPPKAGFDPAQPWRLELLVARERADGSAAVAVFPLTYRPPQALVIPAVGPRTAAPVAGDARPAPGTNGPPLWQRIWRDRAAAIGVLVAALGILTAVLFLQDQIARRPRLFRIIRLSFLAFTLLWLGWWAGAQLSVVNVFTFTQSLLTEFRWDLFLIEPLIFILWSYVAVTMLFWGRGVFCGWLCPFGALQELLNHAARFLRVPQLAVPWGLHERIWPIKYVIFLALLALSLSSLTLAITGAEIEPFKTAIVLRFARAWPYLLFVALLLLVGLFIERFFCRYLCPLGAALAIPARIRMFEWLKRRPECGRPCQTCAVTCTVQAIHPDGHINPNECIHCLQCQVLYHDDQTCPPLIERRKRRERRAALASASMTEAPRPQS